MTDPSYTRFASIELYTPEPEPSRVLIRNSEGFPGLILSESAAWELYLLLDKHFEGKSRGEVD